MRKAYIGVAVVIIVLAGTIFGLKNTVLSPKDDSPKQSGQQQPEQPAFDKSRFSTTDPASLWVIVNKPKTLSPIDYAPSDLVTPNVLLRSSPGSAEMKLRKEAAEALERMAVAAAAQGAKLKLASGYRSYATQIAVYNNEVRQYGKAVADTQSARPGHSEHQTGLGADLQDSAGKCVVADCFKDLIEGKWLAEHAWEYGFIIRYVPGKEAITGYRAEPWHIRYIGPELSAEMHKTGVQTLEEFFSVVEPQPY